MTTQRLRANLDAIAWYAGRSPFKPALDLVVIVAVFGGLVWALFHA